MFYIVGLGNPGEEYENTRHNTGRMAVFYFAEKSGFSEFKYLNSLNGLVAEGKSGRQKMTAILPDTFMNKSGESLKKIIRNQKSANSLIVVHDDLDIPFGKFKISFNKSSGGHKGVRSVMKTIKTEAFIRIRIGISPVSSTGKMKKPTGEKEVGDFILKRFKPSEEKDLKKVFSKTMEAVKMIVEDGKEKAMNLFN